MRLGLGGIRFFLKGELTAIYNTCAHHSFVEPAEAKVLSLLLRHVLLCFRDLLFLLLPLGQLVSGQRAQAHPVPELSIVLLEKGKNNEEIKFFVLQT